MKSKIVFTLIVVSLLLIFLIQNTQVVNLRLYFWEISMSQIILISLAMLVGFILGFIVAKVTGRD
jgi:uncharacterized integral membrane protein